MIQEVNNAPGTNEAPHPRASYRVKVRIKGLTLSASTVM